MCCPARRSVHAPQLLHTVLLGWEAPPGMLSWHDLRWAGTGRGLQAELLGRARSLRPGEPANIQFTSGGYIKVYIKLYIKLYIKVPSSVHFRWVCSAVSWRRRRRGGEGGAACWACWACVRRVRAQQAPSPLAPPEPPSSTCAADATQAPLACPKRPPCPTGGWSTTP